MRAATKKRAAQNRLYSKLRREFLASNPRCQFPDCGNASAELHHKKGRVGRYSRTRTTSPLSAAVATATSPNTRPRRSRSASPNRG
jgi:hypothetical protein